MGSMMQAMQGQDAMGGLDLTERVEGRIAFLKAQLAITDAQADKWNAFADALGAYSAALKSAQPTGMATMASDLVARLDQSEKQLSAEIDGVRGLKTSRAPLMDAPSDDCNTWQSAASVLGLEPACRRYMSDPDLYRSPMPCPIKALTLPPAICCNPSPK